MFRAGCLPDGVKKIFKYLFVEFSVGSHVNTKVIANNAWVIWHVPNPKFNLGLVRLNALKK